ncbi:MAG: hypothetical protein GX162_11210 [Firmicutes bacterium]|nr:hypothetical protein [Bacillota bacterium]
MIVRETEDSREAVGWDGSKIYEKSLHRNCLYYTVRRRDGTLVGYVSVFSDGSAYAFLIDLIVVIDDPQRAGIRCIHVPFDDVPTDVCIPCVELRHCRF